jgi:hypothetical protein
MKRIATLAATLCVIGCATSSAADQEPLSVSTVHEVPGKTGQDICRQARDWVALNFNDSKAVIEVFDLEQGKLIGKGGMPVPGFGGAPINVSFSMQVDCKDGKVRTTFDRFTVSTTYGQGPLREDSLNMLRTKTEARVREMDAALAAHVSKATASW